MDLVRSLLNQYRNPTGWFGRLNVRDMNRRHSGLTDWGLANVAIAPAWTVLDVGCGGGRTVRKLAAIAVAGKTFGIDHAEASVASARALNRRAIARGRAEIRQASVSELPFAAGTFDLVTAVETHFYWPNLPQDLREVLRVLKKGGALLVIAEAYKGGKKDQALGLFAQAMSQIGPYSHLTVDEHRVLLEQGGYAEVRVVEDYEKGWLWVMGRKP